MNELLLDFEDKVAEINDYFNLVRLLDDKEAIDDFRITTQLFKVLKANCYLLLYNLIESSVSEGLDAIFENINAQQVPFKSLNDIYKKKYLKYKFHLAEVKSQDKKFGENLADILSELSLFILSHQDNPNHEDYKAYLGALQQGREFSGNLDARKIKEIAKNYGFNSPNDCNELFVIKNARNHLAHGEKTFSTIGGEKPITELIEIKEKVVFYLKQLLQNISSFIDDRGYLQD